MTIRGLLRPLQVDFLPSSPTYNQYLPMWLAYNASNAWPATATTAMPATGAWPTTSSPVMPFDSTTGGQVNIAYALDPMGVAPNAASAAIQYFPPYFQTAAPPTPTTFSTLTAAALAPYSPMTRVTLRYFPSSTFTAIMPSQQADSIFRSLDDLLLNPTTGDYPPTQDFSINTATATASPGRRQSTGDYSWLATIVPTGEDTRQCIVSIVVFYKRNVLLPSALSATLPPPERMVNMAASTGNVGLGGGDVVLSCASATATTVSSDYVKVKPNQWILLNQAAQPVGAVSPNITSPAWWRWYRVAATSDPVWSGGFWQRNATLAGPDWNPSLTTYASIFDDVIGVYERVMELEEPGAFWSPN